MQDGKVRLDATITYSDNNHEVGVYAHEDVAYDHDNFFKVYAPCAGDDCHDPDECHLSYGDDGSLLVEECISMDSVGWWYLSSGRVLGMLNGMLVEYDPSTLAPLGLVVGADELIGKRIAVIDSGVTECDISEESGMEGADCGDNDAQEREQAVVLFDENNGSVVVVQPNEDGSYWRKIVRNKMIRMKEQRRVKAAREFAKDVFNLNDDQEPNVVSSWGDRKSVV